MAMNKSLAKLKNKLETETYKSNFDFESYEIDPETKNFIIEKEKNLSKNFRKNSDLMFQICKDLYEVSIKLKENNVFMNWYESCGLSKDLVSCFMKRYRLYIEFQDNKDYISSLSDLAVKYLTNKNVTYDDRIQVIENKIKNAEEIKETLLPGELKNQKEFSHKREFNYFDFKNIEKIKKKILIAEPVEINKIKNDIKTMKKEMLELENLLKEKENTLSNENNISLFEKN
ncbi:hypothetical protein [Fusobacterium sp. IOR10]|uniref:hypothetical protein n=1 Tax=Fusobacterium sp. IOR10 TaxID=2665157 RepID=UPI0013D636E0|nr:hypothetical protein [Fusobacterium sp. IOR10]